MEGLLKVCEVASLLGVHKTTVYLWVEQGRLPHVDLAAGGDRRCVRFVADEIRRWVEERRSDQLDGRRRG